MVLVQLIAVLWIIIALAVGIDAESQDRNPWAWFGVTLIFGIFALLVYWATNPPREDEKYNGNLSFKSFASYIFVVFGSIIIGFFIGAIIATTIGQDSLTPRSMTIEQFIINTNTSLTISVGLIGRLYTRHKKSDNLGAFPTGLSRYEYTLIGIFSILLSIFSFLTVFIVISEAYTIVQTLVGILYILIGVGIIIFSVWSLLLGRPINDLRSGVSQIFV